MNQLKQAIAYLVSKIQTAYYGAKFFLSIITSEFPNDRRRMDTRAGNTSSDLRDAGSRSITASGHEPSERNSPRGLGDVPRKTPNAANTPTDESCCGMFSFFDGDFIDGFGDTSGFDPTRTKSIATQNLQNGENISGENEADRGWDLLRPCDRQAIILDRMREYQSRTEDYRVFSTRDVIDICDRSDIEWGLAFDDIMVLCERRSVKINEAYCDRTGKFIGLFWGLR